MTYFLEKLLIMLLIVGLILLGVTSISQGQHGEATQFISIAILLVRSIRK
jgi:hypothetical protein